MFILLLTLIFCRPFISSSAFPYLNLAYSFIILAFLFIWFIYKGFSIRKIESLRHPLILFCLALTISLVFSIDKLSSLKELYKYINGLLLFLLAASLTREDKIRLIRSIALAGFIISVLAIYQYFFGFTHTLEYLANNNLVSSFALDYLQRKRVFFPFVTPNTLAGYLIMIMPLALVNKNRSWFILPLSFALLLTKSLGAFLSLFLALGLYFYLEGGLKKRKIILLLVLASIIGLLFIIRTAAQKQYLQPIFSTIMRLNYWKDALEIIKAEPLTGVGIGNLNLVQSRYAHNSYLQIWAEMGILGIVSFLWLLVRVFKSFLRAAERPAYNKEIAYLAIANLVFLAHNLIDFTFFLPEVTLIWWVVLGLLYASPPLPDKQAGEI